VSLEAAASHGIDTLSFAVSPYPLSSQSSCNRSSICTPTIDLLSFVLISGFHSYNDRFRLQAMGGHWSYVQEWRCMTGSTYPPAVPH
jgi:hypothetical protein